VKFNGRILIELNIPKSYCHPFYVRNRSRIKCVGIWIFFYLQVRRKGQKLYLLGPLVELLSDLH
jgi:hypothetical protein